ncbi:hypothetical protein ACHAWO_001531 [Cyclotella atomus]|uniref:Carbohydrate kinase PfkB domain-containing protein n=1 Tax=Cyclotella atomus TaxID=382360 RepID=A0ABD3MY11_9STRA
MFLLILTALLITMQTAALVPSSTVIIGINAALQKRFILAPKARLEPGNVHRSERVEIGVGGKGQDVAVAMSCLGDCNQDGEDRVILTQFIGVGAEGETVLSALKQRHLSDALTIRNSAPLRTCTTIVSDDCATELVENSGKISNKEMDDLFARVEDLTKDGKAGCLCIMGSMPPGCGEETYSELTKRLIDGNSLVLIDSVVGLNPLLETLGNIYSKEAKGAAVLKLNAAELCKLANVPKKESERVTLEELKESTSNFVNSFNANGLDYLCVTDGKFPGYLIELADEKRTWQMDSIDLSDRGTLYPIGAGDTVAAGTLAAWQYLHSNNGVISGTTGANLLEKEALWSKSKSGRGIQMAAAFAFGIACGSASCLKEENSVFDVIDAEMFLEGMSEPSLME